MLPVRCRSPVAVRKGRSDQRRAQRGQDRPEVCLDRRDRGLRKALVAFKDNEKVRRLIQELANAAARSTAKTPVPGIEFVRKDKEQ